MELAQDRVRRRWSTSWFCYRSVSQVMLHVEYKCDFLLFLIWWLWSPCMHLSISFLYTYFFSAFKRWCFV